MYILHSNASLLYLEIHIEYVARYLQVCVLNTHSPHLLPSLIQFYQ